MPPSSSWSTALTSIASTPDPSTLPDNVLLRHDDWTITIFDGFEKAKFHFLVLPRLPFPLSRQAGSSAPPSHSSAKPTLALTGTGKLTFGSASSSSSPPASVPNRHLKNLEALLASPYAEEVLKRLQTAGEETASLILEEMPHVRLSSTPVKRTWGVHLGFHAVPSMETVHLHVISDDLVSDRLKNKKHYLSFKPDHGFFLGVDDVLRMVRSGAKGLPRPSSFYESLLREPLVGRDGRVYRNMPELKEHLRTYWEMEMRRVDGGGNGAGRAHKAKVASTASEAESKSGGEVETKRAKRAAEQGEDDSSTEDEGDEPVLVSRGARVGEKGLGATTPADKGEAGGRRREGSRSPERKMPRLEEKRG